MEKFKKALQHRLICAGLYCAVVLLMIGQSLFSQGNTHVNDFISGFSLGVCVGIEFVVIFYMGKYISALRNEEKLKKLYILENDERIKMIQAKASSSGMAVAIAGLMLGALVAGYFNETVFFTLVAAALFVTFSFLFIKAYYCKKYSE